MLGSGKLRTPRTSMQTPGAADVLHFDPYPISLKMFDWRRIALLGF